MFHVSQRGQKERETILSEKLLGILDMKNAKKKRFLSLQRSHLPKFLHVLQVSNEDFMINCSSETTGAEEMNTI